MCVNILPFCSPSSSTPQGEKKTVNWVNVALLVASVSFIALGLTVSKFAPSFPSVAYASYGTASFLFVANIVLIACKYLKNRNLKEKPPLVPDPVFPEISPKEIKKVYPSPIKDLPEGEKKLSECATKALKERLFYLYDNKEGRNILLYGLGVLQDPEFQKNPSQFIEQLGEIGRKSTSLQIAQVHGFFTKVINLQEYLVGALFAHLNPGPSAFRITHQDGNDIQYLPLYLGDVDYLAKNELNAERLTGEQIQTLRDKANDELNAPVKDYVLKILDEPGFVLYKKSYLTELNEYNDEPIVAEALQFFKTAFSEDRQ